ncbi:hypothetical protein JKP88DRAFT_281134 [Tribonema minus]|uniref:Uncharacterized protein n=1 Tax=Tribonema minus TaxID=303371 RepID=A0A836C9W0_9STRA|nr:hypothetical protein JKP88DRAFT_281134 [Tribonema minus]
MDTAGLFFTDHQSPHKDASLRLSPAASPTRLPAPPSEGPSTRTKGSAASAASRSLRRYDGDLFSTHGEHTDGITLMSRFYRPDEPPPAAAPPRPRQTLVVTTSGAASEEEEDRGRVSSFSSTRSDRRVRGRAASSARDAAAAAAGAPPAKAAGALLPTIHDAETEEGLEAALSDEEDDCHSESAENGGADSGGLSAEVALRAAKQLYAFSAAAGRELDMLREGALEVLASVAAAPGAPPSAVTLCAAALCNVACCPRARAHALLGGCVDAVLAPLVEHTAGTSASRRHCARCLLYLSCEADACAAPAQDVARVAALLQRCGAARDALTQCHCAAALANAARRSDAAPRAIRLQLVEVAMPILQQLAGARGRDAAACGAAAAAALLALARTDGAAQKLLQAGAARVICGALEQPKLAAGAAAQLAAALQSVVAALPAPELLTQAAVMPPLALLLGRLARRTEMEAAAAVAAVLRALCRTAAHASWLESNGVAATLAAAYRQLVHQRTPQDAPAAAAQQRTLACRDAVVAAGCMAACSERLALDLVRNGAAAALICSAGELLSAGETDTARAAAVATCNLLARAGACAPLLKASALASVARLAAAGDAVCRGAAAHAVANLAAHESLMLAAALARDAAAARSLVAMMTASAADADARLAAAQAAAAAAVTAEACDALLDGGLVAAVAAVDLAPLLASSRAEPAAAAPLRSSFDARSYSDAAAATSRMRAAAPAGTALRPGAAPVERDDGGACTDGAAVALALAAAEALRRCVMQCVQRGEGPPLGALTALLDISVAATAAAAAAAAAAGSAHQLACVCVSALGQVAALPQPTADTSRVIDAVLGFAALSLLPAGAALCRLCCAALLQLCAHADARAVIAQSEAALRFLVAALRVACTDVELLAARVLRSVATVATCAELLAKPSPGASGATAGSGGASSSSGSSGGGSSGFSGGRSEGAVSIGSNGTLGSDLIVAALLRSNTHAARATCSHVFFNLLACAPPRARRALVDRGLLWAAVRAAGDSDGTATSAAAAARALAALSCDAAFADDLLALRLGAVLLRAARASGSADTRAACAAAVARLACQQAQLPPDRRCVPPFRAGLVQVLAECAGGAAAAAGAAADDDPGSSDRSQQERACQEEAQRAAARALHALAAAALSAEAAQVLLRDGFAALLHDAFAPPATPLAVLTDAALAVAWLAQSEAAAAALVKGGAARWLLRVCGACCDGAAGPEAGGAEAGTACLQAALDALYLLSCRAALLEAMVEEGLVDMCAAAAQYSARGCAGEAGPRCAVLAAAIVSSLSYEERYHARLLDAGAVQLCVNMLTAEQQQQQQQQQRAAEHALQALRNFSAHGPAASQLCAHLDALAALAAAPPGGAHGADCLAATLRNISTDGAGRAAMAERCASVAALRRLAAGGAAQRQCDVAAALYNVLADASGEAAAARGAAAAAAAAELAAQPGVDAEAQRLCSAALSLRITVVASGAATAAPVPLAAAHFDATSMQALVALVRAPTSPRPGLQPRAAAGARPCAAAALLPLFPRAPLEALGGAADWRPYSEHGDAGGVSAAAATASASDAVQPSASAVLSEAATCLVLKPRSLPPVVACGAVEWRHAAPAPAAPPEPFEKVVVDSADSADE